MRIRELLKRDLSQKIEEIIQLDQADEHAVYAEITEYVATDSIKRQYGDLLEAINLSRTQPTSGVGVWVSGFFGSGKSSFAKNLGYVLSNPEVMGHRAADLFKAQVDDPNLSDLIDVINLNMPAEVVMFDVQKDKSQADHGSLSISPFVYRVLLRHLGYAEDFDLAELEISLEAEGKLDEFITLFDRRYAAEDPRAGWTGRGRKGAQVWNRAGVVLNEMDPQTYPAVESFAQSLLQNRVEVTPRLLVDRAFELMERRRPGKALFFIIDEVGQYVAYSQERLEDLRAVVELFGTEGRNRVRARRAPAQAWLIVTAQERLDEVTSAIGDDRRVLIAKVRDRFGHEVDLSPADVREVASRRVLSKRPEGEQDLRKLFEANEGKLNAACRLERTSRASEITEQGFVDFYPYLPHYINLSIDIMAGIRLQPGAMRHIGGSNRTIISQVYQMLVNNRTAFADRPVGSLVSLDAIYELIEGQVGSSKQKDIADIAERFKNDPDDRGWALRVAKAVALLEFVRDLPRTEANIAAVLVDKVDRPAPLAEVKSALERLVEAQFVRDTEEGYKLQTAQEKSWEQEKRGFDPRPKERKEIQREILAEIFGEPGLKTYKGLRTFSVGVTVDGTRLGSEGQIPLSVVVAEDEGERGRKTPEMKDQSRNHENEVYWIFALTPEIDKLVAAYYASRQMASKYQQVQSLNKISNEEATSLTAERQEQHRLRSRLMSKLSEALTGGQGIFRGVTKDASDLGRTMPEVFRGLFDFAVPDLYPKLGMAPSKLSGTKEAEEVLKAANLGGLPPVFYDGEDGLNLVMQEGARYVPNPDAEIAKEVLDHLKSENSYGNKVTGKDLETRFIGMPYGWDKDVLKLVLAVLLRAGSIEMTYQGRRFRDHTDPQCRTTLTNNVAFRNASFVPRKGVTLKDLRNATIQYEQLTGDEVDVEEAAIARAFKKLAGEELNALLPVISEARANNLPVIGLLEEHRDTLQEVQSAASDDAVRILAGEGNSFRETRDRVRKVREAVSAENLRAIRDARSATGELWPTLQDRPEGEDLTEKAAELDSLLSSETFYEHVPQIGLLAREIKAAYLSPYTDLHRKRLEAFSKAIEEIKGLSEWALVPEGVAVSVLRPLTSRTCEQDGLPEGAAVCPVCHATMGEIEAELAALSSYRSRVMARVLELATPDEPDAVERVRLAAYFDGSLDTPDAVEVVTERLKEDLLKLLAEGKRIVFE